MIEKEKIRFGLAMLFGGSYHMDVRDDTIQSMTWHIDNMGRFFQREWTSLKDDSPETEQEFFRQLLIGCDFADESLTLFFKSPIITVFFTNSKKLTIIVER